MASPKLWLLGLRDAAGVESAERQVALMEWLNINRSTIEGEPMQDASAAAVRAWLFLAAYCAGQENGGRIAGAGSWDDRKWLKLCGLSVGEVQDPCKLWHWDDKDLVVAFYPAEQEAVQRAKRRGGKAGGKKSGEARSTPSSSASRSPSSTPSKSGSSTSEGVLERKGREGKEKEGKEREGAPADDVLIPTETDVRAWAERVGVDPEFAAQKWASTAEAHGWMQNGQLIDWQRRWKRYWLEDQNEWRARQKKKAAQKSPARTGQFQNGAKPADWKEGDQEWWWSEDVELIEKALHGALLGGQEETADRLREILKTRKED